MNCCSCKRELPKFWHYEVVTSEGERSGPYCSKCVKTAVAEIKQLETAKEVNGSELPYFESPRGRVTFADQQSYENFKAALADSLNASIPLGR